MVGELGKIDVDQPSSRGMRIVLDARSHATRIYI